MARDFTRLVNWFTWIAIFDDASVLWYLLGSLSRRDGYVWLKLVIIAATLVVLVFLVRRQRWLARQIRLADVPAVEGHGYIIPVDFVP